MTIADLLQKAQYSRLTIGNRWLTAGHPKWKVLERDPDSPNDQGKVVCETTDEDEAVKELLKGDPLYKDLL